MDPDLNRIGKMSFERCLQNALQIEFLRDFTYKRVSEAGLLADRLTDERLGRFFRSSDNIDVQSLTGSKELVFKVSDEDYNIKSEIFNEFLTELQNISSEFVWFN
jgi:hypothetical protein